MEIIDEFELEKMIKLQSDYKFMRDDIIDETLKKTLYYYDFLNKNMKNLMLKKDKNTIMYSKYYWYMKYKQRYFEIYEYDIGVEQEGFKLLEELESELEEGLDWAILQEIEES